MIRLVHMAAYVVATFWTALAVAQESPPTESQATNGGVLQNSNQSAQSVEQCWGDFLTKEGLSEGKNERGGHFIYISKSISGIHEPTGSKNWVLARSAAFQSAELTARQSLAETIRTTIDTDRSLAERIFGGDEAPASMQAVANELSLADKGRVLAGKAMDAEIKKYDPKWNGSDSDRPAKIVTLQQQLDANVSDSAAIFASGAFSIAQCEGPTAGDGEYSVLVGLVWSPILERIAESVWDPTSKPSAAPADNSLAQQFAEIATSNPDWMAFTEGARVFTDEKGAPVVVGFGVVPRTDLSSADESRARLLGLAAIDRFVGEKLVATETNKSQYEFRKFSDGSAASFDSSTYAKKIDAVSKELQLSGAAVIKTWRGEHPWSRAGMQVVAVAWSPAWAKDSADIESALAAAERRMQSKGAVPQLASPAPTSALHPSASKAHQGANSSAKNF